MRSISYNSPVVLTFVFISLIFLGIDTMTGGRFAILFLASPAHFHLYSLTSWTSSLFHVMGHANFAHYAGNMMFILLLGPILEEKYGSGSLLLMMMVTTLSTAVANALLFSSSIIGASGIVFMMITLASVTNAGEGAFPLTTLLVLVLFVGKECIAAFTPDNISHFGHIFGGVIGAFMGMALGPKEPTPLSTV